jgi:hypothetical protein
LKLTGRIETEQYIWYKGGRSAGVYDRNWNKLKELPVQKKEFVATPGMNDVSVQSVSSKVRPWVECQFFAKDAPLPVTHQ